MNCKGVLLKFDVPNAKNQVISKDCKIDIPEKVPIILEFNRYRDDPVGYAEVTRTDEGLTFEGHLISPYKDIFKNIEEEGAGGSGGFYNNLEKDEKGFVNGMSLRAVSFVTHPVNPDYKFEIIEEET